MDREKIMQGVRLILEGVGENPDREGLVDTPDRIARMYEEIFAGIGQNAGQKRRQILSGIMAFQISCLHGDRCITGCMRFVKSIFCKVEHHLMPFYGKAHIAYIPDGKVVGISKLARTLEVYAKRPQLQEQLTAQVADALMEYLKPQGAMVMIEAEHTCMTMRGVKKPGSKTITYVCRGAFAENEKLQNQFFSLVK